MKVTRVVWALCGCVAVVMTGFGVVLPVLARRVDEVGAGAETLAAMLAAFALGHTLCAPLAGAVADRAGHRPLIVLGALGFSVSNLGYLWADTPGTLIAARALAGVLTSGMYPAALGMLHAVVPEEQRARHVGRVMAGYGAGFVLGPLIGGVLFDQGGRDLPFLVSCGAGLAAAAHAYLVLPRARLTRPAAGGARAPIPRQLSVFLPLLGLDFAATFAFGLTEPAMAFHFYDGLDWTSTRFGAIVCAYGAALVGGQVALAGWSDRLGRRPVLLLGALLSCALYAGLALLESFVALLGAAVLAGVGVSLVAPALAALYLDLSPDGASSRVMGLKSAATALGSFAGPLTLSLAGASLPAPTVFWVSGAVFALFALLAYVSTGFTSLAAPVELGQGGD